MKDILRRLRPAPVSSSHSTVCSILTPVAFDIHTRYVGRQKKKVTSCGSSANAISMAYGMFGARSGVFVARMFGDVTSILLLCCAAASSEDSFDASTMFVVLTVI